MRLIEKLFAAFVALWLLFMAGVILDAVYHHFDEDHPPQMCRTLGNQPIECPKYPLEEEDE